MQRKILSDLVKWKNSKGRMPLLLNGARQVGKTYIVNEFGKQEYENLVYINLDTNPEVTAIFEGDISPATLISKLEMHTQERIRAGKTLLFIDEIQASERALLSLKYFCEDAPQYHVVAAGSLLGVAVNREKYSFPVGKVDELYLFPFDFEEFMWAMDKNLLAEEIKKHYAQNLAMDKGLHNLSLDLYKQYCVIGGMPSVILKFKETNSFLAIKDAQQKIMHEYIADMSKYATPATSIKIRACYNSIPAQLAKENHKFQYKLVQKGGTATIFGESLEWLNFAHIVLKCQKITSGNIPIAVSAYFPDFKIYMADVGILTMKSGVPWQILLNDIDADKTFMGAVAENYVAQAFTANNKKLFYWKNENTAEVDFVFQDDVNVVPVEVKSGTNTHSKSLNLFMKQYRCPYCIRISQKNFGFENNIKSVPLYAVFCI
ncbi:ATPase [Bacteroidia bacterium]|nr:ATPase [Bacteroidia bacterium]